MTNEDDGSAEAAQAAAIEAMKKDVLLSPSSRPHLMRRTESIGDTSESSEAREPSEPPSPHTPAFGDLGQELLSTTAAFFTLLENIWKAFVDKPWEDTPKRNRHNHVKREDTEGQRHHARSWNIIN